jgi:hypothetical protein
VKFEIDAPLVGSGAASRESAVANAVCLQCGSKKARPLDLCEQCGLDPNASDDATVKNVYLSTVRFHDPDREDDDQTAYAEELDRVAEQIRRGVPIAFDPDELRRLGEINRMLKEVSPTDVWWWLMRAFYPAVLFLLGLWALNYALGCRKSRGTRRSLVCFRLFIALPSRYSLLTDHRGSHV